MLPPGPLKGFPRVIPPPPPHRRSTRPLRLGRVAVGGGAPVSVQSMCSTDTRDSEATLSQIRRLETAGCEIVRVAVPDADAAAALVPIRRGTKTPLVADVHFDHRLALAALEAGVDGLRLNPGNIGARWKVEEVVRAARERSVPIRIGVNAGSLEKALLERFGGPRPEALVESALGHVRLLEDLGYREIKVSLKDSNVPRTVEAYRVLAGQCDYPFHVGITEAGTLLRGAVKSAVGLGILFYLGLGDTVRVSLTGDPEPEVGVAYGILRALGLRARGVEVISCPTCGRTRVGLAALAEEVESRLASVSAPLTVAVMGCEVNGPGEAREADVGVACGRGAGLLFRRGQVVRKVPEAEIADALVAEVEALAGGHRDG
ncbi:MAG: flavodoxin-dependent (E)-4-hydroxy-3-methylbut-2-enyl-diphosphate synthase [Deferrisomatales bacterium]|nr:flavodoxin-dependent (E)-4-hydroxy-3-methylbut-2-enyl-diphosphate synthase [Deferrisomatales bacterium]